MRLNPDADNCYVTTVGRVTGRQHTVEIWYGLSDRTLYVLAGAGRHADFVRNAMRNPHVAIQIGSRTSQQMPAVARIVEAPREDALAKRIVLAKYSPRYDDLAEWSETALVVAFDIAEA